MTRSQREMKNLLSQLEEKAIAALGPTAYRQSRSEPIGVQRRMFRRLKSLDITFDCHRVQADFQNQFDQDKKTSS
jgi:hypothetical protein